MSSSAAAVFERLRPQQSEPDALVFATRTCRPLNRRKLLHRRLRSACKTLGLTRLTLHLLRHSHATMLDSVGAPLGTVQALLGLARSEITSEVYVHAIPEDQRRAVEGVERMVLDPNGLKLPPSSKAAVRN